MSTKPPDQLLAAAQIAEATERHTTEGADSLELLGKIAKDYGVLPSGFTQERIKVIRNQIDRMIRGLDQIQATAIELAAGGEVMNAAAVERELRFGHVERSPEVIAADILAGAQSLAKLAEGWMRTPPLKPSAVSSAQGTVAGLTRLLIDLRGAVHAQESCEQRPTV